MPTPKTYVPKSKAKVQPTNFGDILKLSFHASTLIAFVNEHANAAGYINLDIVPRRETDQYGNTHSVTLNDWKPDANRSQPRQERPASAAAEQPEETNVPF